MVSATPEIDVVQGPERAAALLHPLRQQLLGALRRPDSASGLARRLGLARQKVNYHLREMEEHGLLDFVEERPRRGFTERVLQASARSYLIGPGALGELAADPDEIQDRFSAAFQTALAARAIRELADLQHGARRAGKKLPTFSLETEVRFSSQQDMRAFAEELSRAVARLVRRYHDEAAPKGRRFRFFLGGHPKPKQAAHKRRKENFRS